jgi:ribosomal protein L11 methyltransferase
VRITVRGASGDTAERLAAEACAAGATGLEERGEAGSEGTTLLIYAPAPAAEAVAGAIAWAVACGAEIAAPEAVADVDWPTTWREGLGALVVSPRLVVRPSFVAHPSQPGQETVVIDPGQAFGTGHHASTRLALELLDEAIAGHRGRVRLLDVGTGSGVLAIAGLRLGVASAVAFDLDPVAVYAARENARLNGVWDRVQMFVGGMGALAEVGFEIVVANLLRTELLPLIPHIAVRMSHGGIAIIAGLLEGERTGVADRLCEAGLRCAEHRTTRDANGESWIALLTHR